MSLVWNEATVAPIRAGSKAKVAKRPRAECGFFGM